MFLHHGTYRVKFSGLASTVRLVNSLRHVTSREPLKPWIPREAFLKKSVADRVKYVRTNLPGRGRGGVMSQAQLAAAVEADGGAHTVRRWEQGKHEPREKKGKLATLTPDYQAQDFVSREAEGVSLESIDARLEALEGRIEKMIALTEDALRLLRAARKRTAQAS